MHFSLYLSTSRSADCTYNALLVALIYGASPSRSAVFLGRCASVRLCASNPFPRPLRVQCLRRVCSCLSGTARRGRRVCRDARLLPIGLRQSAAWQKSFRASRSIPAFASLKPPAHRPRAARLSAKHRLFAAVQFVLRKWGIYGQVMKNQEFVRRKECFYGQNFLSLFV